MDDEHLKNFNIRIDEESPDSLYKEANENLDIKRLGRRLTIITVFFLCIIGAISSAGYFKLKKRFNEIHSSGVFEAQKISQDLKSKFSSLMQQFTAFEKSFGDKISSLEKELSLLKGSLNKAEKTIDIIKSTKTEKKELADALAEIDSRVKPISKELKEFESELKSSNKKYLQEFSKLTQNLSLLGTDIKKMKTDALKLSSASINKKELEFALENERKYYQRKIRRLTSSFEDKIISLQRKLVLLENSKALPAPKSSRSEKQTDKILAPEPGIIYEQDIQ